MSQYIHHVPGRLRVRSRTFCCQPAQMRALAEKLKCREGVESVDIKYKAGSITVKYDQMVLNQQALLEDFAQVGCIERIKPYQKEGKPVVGAIAQKALFGTLVQMTVERSVRSLVGAIL